MKVKKYLEIRCLMQPAEGMVLPQVLPGRGEDLSLPYFTEGRTLVIPMAAPTRYWWWKGGISLEAVRAETAGLACPVPVKEIEWG